MKTASITDIGRIRQVNEDRSVVQADLNGFTLAIVADGMGGHQAGDVASQMAADIIQQELQKVKSEWTEEVCLSSLRRAVEEANSRIYTYAFERENYYGMGTTVIAALATPEKLMIAHVGDSRAYLTDDSGLIQLTDDHTLVNELVRSGQITKDEAHHHPRRNMVTRALGTELTVEVDIIVQPWKEKQQLLICSDGLSSLVDDRVIQSVLESEEDPNTKAGLLVQEALTAGGNDNITVVLLVNEIEARDEER